MRIFNPYKYQKKMFNVSTDYHHQRTEKNKKMLDKGLLVQEGSRNGIPIKYGLFFRENKVTLVWHPA